MSAANAHDYTWLYIIAAGTADALYSCMSYKVKWTEGDKKRSITVEYKPLAVVLLRGLIVDCGHYDAKIVEVKG